MQFSCEFLPLALSDLRREAAFMKADHWRFVQTLATYNEEEGVDLYYSFMKDGDLRNYKISGVTPDEEVPSITDIFLAAFVFENEARELFGVNMGPIAIDFQGAMYAPAVDEPMTIISPEQKAALDKLKKANAIKAKDNAGAAQSAADAAGVDVADKTARFEEVLSAAEKGQTLAENVTSTASSMRTLTAAQIDLIKQKIKELPPAKAAKLQAVLDLNENAVQAEVENTSSRVEGNTPNVVTGEAPLMENMREVVVDAKKEENAPVAELISDESLDKLLSLMDEKRANVVLDALRNERA